MKINHFLQLIRFKNLLMLVFVQLLFGLFIIYSDKELYAFNGLSLSLLIVTTILLAASGNIINDFFDLKADNINKPNRVLINTVISKKTALLLYFLLNFMGIISGIILAFMTNKTSYAMGFILISILLYFYSKLFKKTALLGNFIVSSLIAISILMLAIFPSFTLSLYQKTPRYLHLLYGYAFFAFILNFIREIVKDVEDIDGDHLQKMKTLPILIGRKRTLNVLYFTSFIPFITSILLTFGFFAKQFVLQAYMSLFIIMPLGYFMYQIKEANSKATLHKLSTLLKIIMLLGMLSVIIVVY